MNKRIAAVAVLVLIAAGFFLMSRAKSTQSGSTGAAHQIERAEAVTTTSRSAEQRPTSDAPQHGEATGTAGAGGSAPLVLTPVEEEIFTMYEEMATAFEQHHSCFDMGVAVQQVVEAHHETVERSVNERANLSPERAAQRQLELEKGQTERMARLRTGLEYALARCQTNLQLRNAIRELGRLNSPPDTKQ